MWIKRENCQSVNLDLIQTISKGSSSSSNNSVLYFLPLRSGSSSC